MFVLQGKRYLKLLLSCRQTEFHFINTNEKEVSKSTMYASIDRHAMSSYQVINEIHEAENNRKLWAKRQQLSYSGIC
jgi:hypothetical protein